MPVFNESASVLEVAKVALSQLDRLAHFGPGELLILDDASTDETPRILRELAQADPRVRILTNKVNGGVASFERRLLEECRGEWYFFGSSDGETDYNDVGNFLQTALKLKLHAVLGFRKQKNYTFYRSLISTAFRYSLYIFFGQKIRDSGWIRLLHVPTFRRIPTYSLSAFITAERTMAAREHGFALIEIEVNHLPRKAGRGRGGQVKWVYQATRDLLRTRLRWFGFHRYYQLKNEYAADSAMKAG